MVLRCGYREGERDIEKETGENCIFSPIRKGRARQIANVKIELSKLSTPILGSMFIQQGAKVQTRSFLLKRASGDLFSHLASV